VLLGAEAPAARANIRLAMTSDEVTCALSLSGSGAYSRLKNDVIVNDTFLILKSHNITPKLKEGFSKKVEI